MKSTKLKAENARQVSEYVPIRIFNRTRKKMCIRKGTVLATAEAVSPETLSTLTEYTVEKAIQNHQILAAVFSSDIAKGVSAVHTAYTDPCNNPVTHANNTMVQATTKPDCLDSVTHQAEDVRGAEALQSQKDKGERTPSFMVESNLSLSVLTIDSPDVEPTSSMEIEGAQVAQADVGPLKTDSEWASFMQIGGSSKGALTVQRNVGGSVGEASFMSPEVTNSVPDHNWHQQCNAFKAEEQGGSHEQSKVEVAWAQDKTHTLALEETLCAVDKNTIAKTVSERREEVISYHHFKQSEESIQALYDTMRLGSPVVLENPEASQYACAMNKKGEEGVKNDPEGITNNPEHLQHLQHNLIKDTGTTNMENCIKDIKSMVGKAKCDETQKAELEALFLEHKEQFLPGFTKEFPAGSSFFVPHEIKLATDYPVWIPQFRQSVAEKNIIEENNEKMLKGGVVERSTSPWNSPVMCVPKKDKTWRPVIDYREINKITIKEQWPITRSDEAYDALSKAKYMTVVDCTSGYWQIPLAKGSRRYTAYTIPSGRYQYASLPMGITNAAPTFQKNMEIMLTGLLWKCVIVYIDDIIVYSDTFEEHKAHLREVLKRLKAANIVLKPEKCDVCQNEVEYLGHIVGNGVLRTTKHNVDKVKECKLPETITEVRSFCNLAGFYRRFIHKYADIAKPLTEYMSMTGKKKKVTLTEQAKHAFYTLKKAISEEPVLSLVDFDKPFGVRTDASGYAIGAVLFQLDDEGNEKPISYASRTLNGTEQKYSASEREMLAIYDWIRYWRPYLWGTHFKVYTDHSPLTGIKTKKDVSRRLTRMILNLQEYDFELHYTPGKLNVVADALSRNPIAGYEQVPIKEITEMIGALLNNQDIKEI